MLINDHKYKYNMKTPQELQRIFDRLPKEKVELEKVELGIIDDLATQTSKLEKASVADKDFNQLVKENNSEVKEIVKQIEKAESSRNKLMDKGEKMVNQNNDLFNKVDDILNKAKNAAKDLGVKPESITNFKKAEGLMDNLVIANPNRDFIDNSYF